MRPIRQYMSDIALPLKTVLYSRLRLNRRPSNQLMMIWLKKALIDNKHLKTAIDVGCGKSINRKFFKNKRYIGVDFKEKFIENARNYYVNDSFYVVDLAHEVPPAGNLVVCTLVFNNKRYPLQRTLEGLNNLIKAVSKGGSLIFTIGNSNYRYKNKIDKILKENFENIISKKYGNFNIRPTYLSYPISFLMHWFKPLRIDKSNKMYFYSCSRKKNE